jgi:DNA-binding transcriptional MerR regulator
MEQEYSIGELASLAGVTPRTIRYYVSIGLLSSPGQQGPGTRYGEGHLARLRLIRRLQREHIPLGEIAQRLDGLSEEAVEGAAEAEGVAAGESALEYIRRLKHGRSMAPMPAREPVGTLSAPSVATQRLALREAPDTSVPNPPEPQRSQWERVPLSPHVELHIRRPLGRLDQKRVERLIRIGREILEEGDQP